jgi:hypothetical protein
LPGAKFWRATLLPPEISSRAQANVSRRPFPRARQHFPPVLAAYKSGRGTPPWTQKTLFVPPPPKTFPPAAGNGTH